VVELRGWILGSGVECGEGGGGGLTWQMREPSTCPSEQNIFFHKWGEMIRGKKYPIKETATKKNKEKVQRLRKAYIRLRAEGSYTCLSMRKNRSTPP
jgi:hypothetical protein